MFVCLLYLPIAYIVSEYIYEWYTGNFFSLRISIYENFSTVSTQSGGSKKEKIGWKYS